LPHPTRVQPELTRALTERSSPAERGRVTVTHVLYAQCQCSRSIVEHLVARRARRDVGESSILVGPADEFAARLRPAGYRVEVVTARELKARYAIEAAPLLIVADAAHSIRYIGGYTVHKQSADIRDVAIIDAVLAGQAAQELPLLGCAVSRALQKLSDPWGLRYATNKEDARDD
jgi:hypothetical protein